MPLETTTAAGLTARFEAPDGFKKYIGFLGGKLARNATEIYTTAERRGAAQSYLLDQREHDGTHYHLRAISIDGDLDGETLAELTRAVQLVPLGTVRYEGMMAATLPDPVGGTDDARDIHDLSRLDRGIVVYPITELSKKGASSWALWAIKDGQTYLYPLEDKKL
jgi:hypothetical protein